MKTLSTLCALALLLFLSNCTYLSEGVVANKERYAEATAKDLFGDSADKIVYLDQNWDRYDSLWFYFTTQGSDFMPYDVFLGLEQTDSTELFRSSGNINKYRFLPQKPSDNNPEGLPVGFVEDSYQGKDYIGFTCAACHTTQINYQGTGIRIDGGPALADFESFFDDIGKALKATLDDPEKFHRLAKLMVEKEIAATEDDFRKMLEEIYNERKQYNADNSPTQGSRIIHYGYGRLDAFGRIYNRILEHLTPGQVNANPANAPVSYPFLWDTPQHDFVQWNGVASNNQGGLLGFLGPLSRNVGEVLGVFAIFDLKNPCEKGYCSSAVKRNIIRLEDHLVSLQSPLWPEDILPPIDRPLAKQGEQVYKDYKCDSCHGDPEKFDRSSSERRVIAQFASLPQIGSDPAMAMNALQYQGNSGVFKGQPIPDSKPPVNFGETTPVLPALQKAGAGVILEPDHDKWALHRGLEQIYDFIVAKFSNPINETKKHVDFEINNAPSGLAAYKARTLNGIWATAPYLHNGSVPNLYELFLPSCSDSEIMAEKKCRSNRFTLGSREFDPINVGLASKDRSTYPGLFEFDTSLPGNRNNGHEYAAGNTPIIKFDAAGKPIRKADGQFEVERLPVINDNQRRALVEYLKTL